MQFKDAAFQILQNASTPLHYNAITDRALAAGLLETTGKTPHATMGALLYTDSLKPASRFRRGDEKGTFALKTAAPASIQAQIEAVRLQARSRLKKDLLRLHSKKFEELIRALLVEMGFVETETTPYRGDQGVDVRGVLQVDRLTQIRVAIQAKRWTHNVGPEVIQKLRGALKITAAENGIVITPSDFTPAAVAESQAPGTFPISLVNGEQLAELLIQYQVGVRQTQYILPEIDLEYWTEVLGLPPDPPPAVITETGPPALSATHMHYPLPIQVSHKGRLYTAELLDEKGTVRMAGKEYPTPTTAAKALPFAWKEVNGWDFWRFEDPLSGKLIRIGSLRPVKAKNSK